MSFCGITTFNPDLERLQRNLDAITNEVDTVVLWDNGSRNIIDIERLASNYDNVIIKTNGNNEGVGYALNRLAEEAVRMCETTILYLDQDSVSPQGLYKELDNEMDDNTAIVSPRIQDINVKRKKNSEADKELYLYPITSGSLVNLEVWKRVGGFNDDLFIDCVDTEFDLLAFLNGYASYRLNNTVLTHEIGHVAAAGIPFPHIDDGKLVIRKGHRGGHSPFRTYYQVRNTLYLHRTYRKKLELLHIELPALYSMIFHTLIFEDKRIQRMRAIVRAFLDEPKLETGIHKHNRNYL